MSKPLVTYSLFIDPNNGNAVILQWIPNDTTDQVNRWKPVAAGNAADLNDLVMELSRVAWKEAEDEHKALIDEANTLVSSEFLRPTPALDVVIKLMNALEARMRA